ncbi:MAG: hypothetical protein SFT81_02190 [Candidatus Caenarcaniphilales bacterium]|nr:hypothetical protein [Candidatus Caenarcaniphilales bacterium]
MTNPLLSQLNQGTQILVWIALAIVVIFVIVKSLNFFKKILIDFINFWLEYKDHLRDSSDEDTYTPRKYSNLGYDFGVKKLLRSADQENKSKEKDGTYVKIAFIAIALLVIIGVFCRSISLEALIH